MRMLLRFQRPPRPTDQVFKLWRRTPDRCPVRAGQLSATASALSRPSGLWLVALRRGDQRLDEYTYGPLGKRRALGLFRRSPSFPRGLQARIWLAD